MLPVSRYDLSTVGGRIGWAIEARFASQAKFAREAGKPVSQVNRWITKSERGVSDDSLELVAKLTHVPVAWLRYGGELEAERVPRETNRAHEIIGRAHANSRLQGPDVAAALIDGLKKGLTSEEWQDLARWAAEQITVSKQALETAAELLSREAETQAALPAGEQVQQILRIAPALARLLRGDLKIPADASRQPEEHPGRDIA